MFFTICKYVLSQDCIIGILKIRANQHVPHVRLEVVSCIKLTVEGGSVDCSRMATIDWKTVVCICRYVAGSGDKPESWQLEVNKLVAALQTQWAKEYTI